MTDQTPSPPGDYKVGKGRPPRETQFKKGQSGNPTGRPKKKRPATADINRILDEPVTVTQNGTKTKMSPKEITLHKQLEKAVKGNIRAFKHLFSQFDKYDAIDWSTVDVGGVVTLPSTMPRAMAMNMLLVYGKPPWTAHQTCIARSHYIKHRTEQERIEDEAIGYSDL